MYYWKIFIGSPKNLSDERDLIKLTIKKLNEELYYQKIILQPFDYKELFSEPIPPQQSINQHIKNSDLVIVLFGSRIGDGTLEEFHLAKNQYADGKIKNLMVYFKKMPKESMEDPGPKAKAVLDFKQSIENTIFFHEFEDKTELEKLIIKHLRNWIYYQKDIFDIITQYEKRIDKNIIETMRVSELPFTDKIFELLETKNEDELRQLEDEAYNRYLDLQSHLFNSSHEQCYLIAKKLYRGIQENNYALCRHKAFIFPIHQYLSKMIRTSDDKKILIKNLINWLVSRDKVYPTSRDFAAFELGMTKSFEAIQELLFALADNNELLPIRYYSAMSLGMIKQREVINKLIDIYQAESVEQLQVVIAHVIYYLLT